MTLKLTNSTTKEVFSFEVEDREDSRIFYHFSLPTEDMPEGSYSYVLLDKDGVVKAQGVAQVGDYVENNKQTYNDDGTAIKYYEG